ncbi:beta-N-acetylglucosaminidase domain-containing protein [Streptomyces sp. ISL-1]|uniref:beta-N-acetylglucosaminidase domain-containing protein n=1 Tax=Streptomyces sp. ISL-1 TaxID=2817657 RepID=UPI001BE5FB5B|nr:beta-N-acetylglucosaminidase domain-containing protein [Streptomyces sp. ISL-1]MBT2393470.1 beta-N-acetylglucosaminidase domain-containing protein [Streptomyces sp. ISL-1]
MRLARRRRTATAVAVAVIGSLLGGAHGAVAAPEDPGSLPSTAKDPEGESALPSVWPRPQTMRAAGSAVPLGDEVTVAADRDADPYAVERLKKLLRDAGVRTVHTQLPGRGPVLRIGGTGAQNALRALRAPERADLPSGGYRLAVGQVEGRDTVALDGLGGDGLFHGVQTLRQLITDRKTVAGSGHKAVAGVLVRDWPGTAVRGLTEGFYGQPWSHQQRLAQLDFMGRTKQNRYLYAPGDDPFRQARWRDPYPAAQRAEFRELAERARQNHVTLAWAVAPAQEMCLAKNDDVRALTRKIDAMWALGVRAFQLQFQDVSYSEWHCDKDADAFGSGPEAAARAHARVAGAVARHLADRYPVAEPLSLMPTEFYQEGATDYRRALASELDSRVQVAWTGVGVVPRTITGRELAGARDAFRHPLVTMDNYPVNDYAQDRMFLGPYTGREPAVASGSAALLANAMEQASASRIPLFTAADYAWNPKSYRPQESWQAAINDLAGGDAKTREALRALAGNHASSILSPSESGYLQPLLKDFWWSRTTTDVAARDRAAASLRAAFTVMREAPERLKRPADGRLGDEVRPWLEQLARYGRAGELSVDMLQAQARGDGEAAWRASLDLELLRKELGASRATVGKGVLNPFLERAAKESAAWTGADRVKATAGDDTVWLDRTRPVAAVTVMSEPGHGTAVAGADGTPSGTAGSGDSGAASQTPRGRAGGPPGSGSGSGGRLEAHVPGEGWRTLAPLSASGWTQADAKGLRMDAVRIASDGGEPVAVRSVVPWFADEPAAGLDLVQGETNAEIGGGPQRAGIRLTARRPAEVRGALTAKAPAGIKVSVPKETTVPRGLRTTVPVEVTVPAGTPAGEYQVPLSFAGQERTLTVRAYPRTAGPDLARAAGSVASSSGDETADFPAASAIDADPRTRWSSPVEDGAWWQLELKRPARVGQLVLHWQDAYATKYRVQVSSDGRIWRTAATVTTGRGGRETVRMDSRDTRFIRVQGEARATQYGYSLWSVEAYAVAE